MKSQITISPVEEKDNLSLFISNIYRYLRIRFGNSFLKILAVVFKSLPLKHPKINYFLASLKFSQCQYNSAEKEIEKSLNLYKPKIPPARVIRLAIQIYHQKARCSDAFGLLYDYSLRVKKSLEITKIEMVLYRYKWAKTRAFLEKNKKIENWGGTPSSTHLLDWRSIAEDATLALKSPFAYQYGQLSKIVLNCRLLEAETYRLSGHSEKFVQSLKLAVSPENGKNELLEDILTQIVRFRLEKISSSDMPEKLALLQHQNQSSDFWFALYYIFAANGWFEHATTCRKTALLPYRESIHPESSMTEITDKTIVALEDLDLNKAQTYLAELKTKLPDPKTVLVLESHLQLLREKKLDFKFNSTNKEHKRFHNYISGKSVAIVGPAPDGELLGKEIDSFDIVIRFNYTGKNRLPRPEEFGSRTDISYYNASNLLDANMPGKSDHLHDLKFFVYKEPGIEFNDEKVQARSKALIKSKLIHNESNALPNTLFDLFHYKPSRVKVFKSNFFCSQNIYTKEYVANRAPSNITDEKLLGIQELILSHDLLAQLIFVRNFWNVGLIEADSGCTSILQLSDEQYMNNMQEIYGPVKTGVT